MVKKFDFMVVGAGMAGASAAYELSKEGSVIVLEQEMQPGYHSTGRSAAMFLETYGNATIRGLTSGSRAFYEALPKCFGDMPVLTPRGAVFIGGNDGITALEDHFKSVRILVKSARWIGKEELKILVPYLRETHWDAGVFEPDAQDLNVHAIHYGYLRGLKLNGGQVALSAAVKSLERVGGDWVAETILGDYSAPVVINAAGAWGDQVAEMAGVRRIGLIPKRRTGVIIDMPKELDAKSLPYVGDIEESFYIKPEGTRLFISPCDETDVSPCDAVPDEYDIAVAMSRMEAATTLSVKQLSSKLAGLRSFVSDRTPVVGFGEDGFFWLVGQGGYGIQTAPAMSKLCADLVAGRTVSMQLQDLGVQSEALSPYRLALVDNTFN